MLIYSVALLCVLGIAIGQILFKLSATALAEAGTFIAIRPAAFFLAAVVLYGITSVIWVWTLQRIALGRVYPLMALAFIIVPVASHFVFAERFPPQYMVGVALIVCGIVVAVRS